MCRVFLDLPFLQFSRGREWNPRALRRRLLVPFLLSGLPADSFLSLLLCIRLVRFQRLALMDQARRQFCPLRLFASHLRSFVRFRVLGNLQSMVRYLFLAGLFLAFVVV